MSTPTGINLSRSQIFVLGFLAFLILVLFMIRIVLVPILVASLIAFLCDPFLGKLEKRGISRGWSATAIIGLGCIFLLVAVGLFVPLFLQQLTELMAQLPALFSYLEKTLVPKLIEWGGRIFGPLIQKRAADELQSALSSSVLGNADILISGLTRSTQTIAYWIFEALLTPIIAFLFIRNSANGIERIKYYIPDDIKEKYSPIFEEFNTTLRSVFRGQILTVSLLALLYSVSYSIAGMPYGFAIGLITGFMRLIPYMDIAVGGTLAALVILIKGTGDTSMIIASAACFGTIQVLDQFLLTPRILGKFSGIHPVALVLAVLCFGDWLGFLGVLLAIPLAAIGRVALTYLMREYKQSKFFRNNLHE
jgi:predicted PurR-regulated permease PerM